MAHMYHQLFLLGAFLILLNSLLVTSMPRDRREVICESHFSDMLMLICSNTVSQTMKYGVLARREMARNCCSSGCSMQNLEDFCTSGLQLSSERTPEDVELGRNEIQRTREDEHRRQDEDIDTSSSKLLLRFLRF